MPVTSSDIVNGLQGKLQEIQKFGTDIKALIARGLNKSLIQEIVTQGPDVGLPYAEALLSATSGEFSAINTMQDQINSATSDLSTSVGSSMYDAGINAAQGIIDGLNKKKKDLETVAADFGNTIVSTIKKALGIKSPSSVLREQVGKQAALGVAEGIRQNTHHAVKAATDMANKVTAAASGATSGVNAATLATVTGIASRTQGGDGAAAPMGNVGSLMHVENLHVRSDNDIAMISRNMYLLTRSKARAQGLSRTPARTG
jgi:hypothetical protein